MKFSELRNRVNAISEILKERDVEVYMIGDEPTEDLILVQKYKKDGPIGMVVLTLDKQAKRQKDEASQMMNMQRR
jgi:hypothetical protein